MIADLEGLEQGLARKQVPELAKIVSAAANEPQILAVLLDGLESTDDT